MKKLKQETLDTTYGGTTTITGPIINAIVNVIRVLKEAGYGLGSGIRRISENNLCPLE